MSSPTSGEMDTGKEAQLDAISLLEKEHRKINNLIDDYYRKPDSEKVSALKEITEEWTRHSMLEEELLLPAAREAGLSSEAFDDSEIERDLSKVIILDIAATPSEAGIDKAKVRVLFNRMRQVMSAEEEPKAGLFAQMKASGVDVESLGERLESLRKDLAERHRLPRPSLSILTFGQDARSRQR